MLYPFAALCGIFCICLLFYLLSTWSFQIGKDYDKKYHPQDWQHWHWTTNCYITNVVIYNRS